MVGRTTEAGTPPVGSHRVTVDALRVWPAPDFAADVASGLCTIIGARAGFVMCCDAGGWTIQAGTPRGAELSGETLARLEAAMESDDVLVLSDLRRSDRGARDGELGLAVRLPTRPPMGLLALGIDPPHHERGIPTLRSLADVVGGALRHRPADIGTTERSRAANLVVAGMVLSANLELNGVLERLVDTAREVLGTRYAALGVLDGEGRGLAAFVASGITEEERARIVEEPTGRGLLGILIGDTGPIRIDSIAADPRSAGFPSGHPPMTSFLGVPVRVGTEVFGNLYLTDKIDGPFTEEDEYVALTLAAQAAVAIANANRFGEKERAVLAAARAKEHAAEDGLRRAIDAQEAERARVARELHDGVGQELTALSLRLRALEEHVNGEVGLSRLQEVRTAMTRASTNLRELALELRPSGLKEHGLASAIERQAARLSDASGISIAVAFDAVPGNLPEPTEIALFRAVQEALTNVVRHSEARHASVTAGFHDHRLRVVVEDDGKGFDPSEPTERLGLIGIRERMELIGGHVRVESAPRSGATVILELEMPNG